jgi:hypothetical protein
MGARENWGAAEEAGEFWSLLSCSQGHYESWEGTKSEKSGAYQLVGFLHGKKLSFVFDSEAAMYPGMAEREGDIVSYK